MIITVEDILDPNLFKIGWFNEHVFFSIGYTCSYTVQELIMGETDGVTEKVRHIVNSIYNESAANVLANLTLVILKENENTI
jgi:hypothetical protein